MMEETIENMKSLDNSSASGRSTVQSENSGIKWKSVPYQVANRMSTFILSIISTIYPLLTRFLTLVLSIELTVQWYYNFVDKYYFIEALAYTLPFICGVVLLSDLVMDDEESEKEEYERPVIQC
jgi:hypothetical protein